MPSFTKTKEDADDQIPFAQLGFKAVFLTTLSAERIATTLFPD
jgi:hypothetical protein